jgi:UDPglucose--hexose-1-phosphate uridylyltransferase
LYFRGQQESPSKITLPEYDPAVFLPNSFSRSPPNQDQCYLCPGNKRAQGDVNPKYENTFVFVNDYSAVKESQAEYVQEGDPKGQPISLVTFCAHPFLRNIKQALISQYRSL